MNYCTEADYHNVKSERDVLRVVCVFLLVAVATVGILLQVWIARCEKLQDTLIRYGYQRLEEKN